MFLDYGVIRALPALNLLVSFEKVSRSLIILKLQSIDLSISIVPSPTSGSLPQPFVKVLPIFCISQNSHVCFSWWYTCLMSCMHNVPFDFACNVQMRTWSSFLELHLAMVYCLKTLALIIICKWLKRNNDVIKFNW